MMHVTTLLSIEEWRDMYTQMEKAKENRSRATANAVAQKKSNVIQGFGFVDNRPELIAQRKLQGIPFDSQQIKQMKIIEEMFNCRSEPMHEGVHVKQMASRSQRTTQASKIAQLFGSGRLFQRKVSTNGGDWEAPTYKTSEDNCGAEIRLEFEPSRAPFGDRIGLVQSVERNDDPNVILDPEKRLEAYTGVKVAEKDRSGRIDRNSWNYDDLWGPHALTTSPVYGATNDANSPPAAHLTDKLPHDLGGTTYGMRHRIGKNQRAVLEDTPTSTSDSEEVVKFETTALVLEGKQQGTYLGSVRWGYRKEQGSVELTPETLEKASDGDPTQEFVEAAEAWNTFGPTAAPPLVQLPIPPH